MPGRMERPERAFPARERPRGVLQLQQLAQLQRLVRRKSLQRHLPRELAQTRQLSVQQNASKDVQEFRSTGPSPHRRSLADPRPSIPSVHVTSVSPCCHGHFRRRERSVFDEPDRRSGPWMATSREQILRATGVTSDPMWIDAMSRDKPTVGAGNAETRRLHL